MSNEKTANYSGGGVGFSGLLCVAFVVLKLCGVIHWSWFCVTIPAWGPIAALALFCAVLYLILGGVMVVERLWRVLHRSKPRPPAAEHDQTVSTVISGEEYESRKARGIWL